MSQQYTHLTNDTSVNIFYLPTYIFNEYMVVYCSRDKPTAKSDILLSCNSTNFMNDDIK